MGVMMVFVPKVVDGECREFAVVPPAGLQFDEVALQNRIGEALREAFPQSGFTIICTDQSLRSDEFWIVPVVSESRDGPATRMPQESVLAEMMAFLTANFAAIPTPTLN
jgi:hypothetical protein